MAKAGATSDTGLPLGEHLEQLRWTMMRCLIALVIGVAVCFLFFDRFLIDICLGPIQLDSVVLGRPAQMPTGEPIKLLTIKALDRFKMVMVAALLGGGFFAAPWIVWEVWRFIAVGLYPHERRLVFLVLPAGVFFFVSGSLFGYFILMPVALEFLLGFGGADLPVQSELIVGDYLTYFFAFTIMLGLVFEIPLLIAVVARVTDISPEVMKKFRRHMIVASLVIGMIMTPPDPVTQMLVAVPIILLFELGLFLAVQAHKARLRAHEAAMQGPSPWEEILDGTQSPNGNGNDGDGDGATRSRPTTAPTGPTSTTSAASPATARDSEPGFVVGETPLVDHWMHDDDRPTPPAVVAPSTPSPAAEPAPPPPAPPAFAPVASLAPASLPGSLRWDDDSDRMPTIRPPTQSVARQPASPPPPSPPPVSGELGPFHRDAPGDAPGDAPVDAPVDAPGDTVGDASVVHAPLPMPAVEPIGLTEVEVITMIDERLRHFVVDELPRLIADELRRQLGRPEPPPSPPTD